MSTRKYTVEFLGIPSIHALGKDLTVTVKYSNSFRTQPGDEVVLIPVGWKSLSEGRSTLQPRNSTSFVIPTAELSCDDPETTFHLLYVQNGVVFGASNQFLVGIPCDEDSLPCESIDSYTILVHSGRDQGAEELPKKHRRGNIHAAGSEYIEASSKGDEDICKSAKTRRRGGSVSSINASKFFHRSVSNISTDDESFVVTDMPPSLSDTQSGENQLQVMVTQVMREKDEFSRLFRRERNIAEQQEKKNADLRRAHDALAEENLELARKLQEKDCKLLSLKKSYIEKNQKLSHTSDDCVDQSPWLQTREVADELISKETVKRPPPCLPPSFIVPQPWIEIDQPAAAVDRQRSKAHIVSRRSEPVATSDLNDYEQYQCPMCPLTFEEVNSATFQQHVHSHFND
ncbi:uncharacterized protein LOC134194798 [Corticium candelabrum]|uniref:uncharacterized protein LOC134194798 n=1 Tax=Corticium candelabrum TaxID=121492 RepID=UPI002E27439B|nr:uncharacterized protein LOC134194798 [Corticium candelabrum]